MLLRTGRILVVEPETELRHRLDERLAEAGHDVAAVADHDRAVETLREGLDPDVVIAEVDAAMTADPLRELAPLAAHLRIDRALQASAGFQDVQANGTARCTADPLDILRRVEEALLEVGPQDRTDEPTEAAGVCLDLARRLANALPRVADAVARIEIVTETFDTFFGVRGTVVVHRGPGPDDWVEASQGLGAAVADRLAREIGRRAASGRGIRPFLTALDIEGERHDVAGVAVRLGERETVLALDLRAAPRDPRHREALMNLVGSAVRAASQAEELQGARELTIAQEATLAGLLDTAREFARIGHRRLLAERILSTLRRETGMPRAALFLVRPDGGGLLDVVATTGFPAALLDRIGLSRTHGVGRACLEVDGLLRLHRAVAHGPGERELRRLGEVGLQWGAGLHTDRRPLGLLVFGGREDAHDLPVWERRFLEALAASAALALRQVDRLEEIQNLSLIGLKGLVAANELANPADRGHAARVARAAVRLGRASGLDSTQIRELSVCAYLHDVGKLCAGAAAGGGDPAHAARRHPLLGSRIVSHARPYHAVIQGIEQHHERWDGQGYPYGLRGSGIHVFGRIVAIADAFDRSVTRPERPLAPDEALKRLERGAGLLWDPGLVAAFSSEVGRAPSGDTAPFEDAWIDGILRSA